MNLATSYTFLQAGKVSRPVCSALPQIIAVPEALPVMQTAYVYSTLAPKKLCSHPQPPKQGNLFQRS